MPAKKLLSDDKPEDQFFNIKGWVLYYKENNKFPHNKILCAECKHTSTSMFGNNLKSTLAKYKNNPETLLTQFVCRACRSFKSLDKKIKDKKIKDKAPKERTPKETRQLTQEELEDHKEKIRAIIPKIDFGAKPIPVNKNMKDQVEILTASSCMRPDIYLDNGRWCNGCDWSKYCICPIKKISDKEIQFSKKRKR